SDTVDCAIVELIDRRHGRTLSNRFPVDKPWSTALECGSLLPLWGGSERGKTFHLRPHPTPMRWQATALQSSSIPKFDPASPFGVRQLAAALGWQRSGAKTFPLPPPSDPKAVASHRTPKLRRIPKSLCLTLWSAAACCRFGVGAERGKTFHLRP